MDSFILDTNFFINLQRPLGLGSSKEEVVDSLIKKTEVAVKKHELELLTTPASFEELVGFFEDQEDVRKKLLRVITIQSPDTSTLSLQAGLFVDLVEEIGKRLYKGLRITEETIRTVIQDSEKDTRSLSETYVKLLRERYRKATREGFLDSTVDLGLIFLARQKNGTLVSSDNGLLLWAQRFGCKQLFPEHFAIKLSALFNV
ncbi:MAG: RNA ligase partner protein [Candidatus Roizmanbacteria bacterium]|nr:RNA ligase partner protein [Candidatus Roizmanbacteria bacterium]